MRIAHPEPLDLLHLHTEVCSSEREHTTKRLLAFASLSGTQAQITPSFAP